MGTVAALVRSVVARIPAPGPDRAGAAGSSPVVLRAALDGALGALLAYVAGLLLLTVTAALLPEAVGALSACRMLLQTGTALLVDHPVAVAWVSALIALSLAAATTGRAREWI